MPTVTTLVDRSRLGSEVVHAETGLDSHKDTLWFSDADGCRGSFFFEYVFNEDVMKLPVEMVP
jgi:hypothetical protein